MSVCKLRAQKAAKCAKIKVYNKQLASIETHTNTLTHTYMQEEEKTPTANAVRAIVCV